MSDVNWLAVVVAAVSGFLVGGVWYSPLMFTKRWQRESGVTGEQFKNSSMPMIFAASFVLTLLAAFMLALLLAHRPGLASGAAMGFHVAVFFVATSLGVNYLFERRSVALWLINSGYNVVTFTLMGAIIGAMQG